MSQKKEPPAITLSIQIQYSPEEGQWVATSETHEQLNGQGATADKAFIDLCHHEMQNQCNCK